MNALELSRIATGRAPPPPPPKLPPPRPTNQDRAREALERITQRNRHERDDPEAEPSLDMTDVFGGVTVGWLSKVFNMDPSDIKRRLADCPVMHRRKAGYVYDLKLAARYIVKPIFDARKYIETMKPSELPANLQDTYWKSQLARQKYELNAGELWRSADVMMVLGDVFKTIKFTMQLWADNLERQTGLTEKQRFALVGMVDALQNELHQKLVEMKDIKQTPHSGVEKTEEDDFGLV